MENWWFWKMTFLNPLIFKFCFVSFIGTQSLGLPWFLTKNNTCVNICSCTASIYLKWYEKIEFSRSRTLMNILWSNWEFFAAFILLRFAWWLHLISIICCEKWEKNAIFTFVICWNFPRIPHSLSNRLNLELEFQVTIISLCQEYFLLSRFKTPYLFF